jgi:hypothetical protein
MNEDPAAATPHPAPTALAPRWPIYLGVSITSGASAAFSLLAAVLSINAVVIYVSIFTSVACFALALALVFHRRNGLAFVMSLATVPIFFGVTILYMTTTPFRMELVQQASAINRFVVDSIKNPQAALDQAIRDGAIRRATADDVKAFGDAYLEKKYTSQKLPVPETEDALAVSSVDIGRAYVVLAPFTYPSGLINEYRVVFFVPRGVPEPTGDMGHSALYDFASLTVMCKAARTGGIFC